MAKKAQRDDSEESEAFIEKARGDRRGRKTLERLAKKKPELRKK